MKIIQRDSPNHGPRPAGVAPSLIVVHGTAGRTDAGDVDWCTQPESQVSYHYIVGRDGTLYALVPEDRRAWHAGRSEWEGRQNVNDYSIGIGISNSGAEPYTAAQYETAGKLVAELCARYGIPWRRVVGHCHVSPDRKTDPWLHFHWGALFDAARQAAGC